MEYGTATRIKTFKDMGYDLIQDEFPKDAIFDDKDIDRSRVVRPLATRCCQGGT
ncbi:MAG: mucin-binding protein [Streptococcus salivarius]